MQNRFVLEAVPFAVRQPAAEEALREYVEDNACWLDRFAWVHGDDEQTQTLTAAFELNLENWRDLAITFLDGREIVLAMVGIRFLGSAKAATAAQSADLLAKCAANGKGCGAPSAQVLELPFGEADPISLTVHQGTEGGTGAEVWRGSLLLAEQICGWLREDANLFCGQDVLELGAGAVGLPSLALAAGCARMREQDPGSQGARSIVASDSIDEVLAELTRNAAANGLQDLVDVRRIDWSDVGAATKEAAVADVLLFSDCIYTPEGATLLCNAIDYLVRPGGVVLGVLPDLRVGVDSFERALAERGFTPKRVELAPVSAVPPGFRCAGGDRKHYRILQWSDHRRRRARLEDEEPVARKKAPRTAQE